MNTHQSSFEAYTLNRQTKDREEKFAEFDKKRIELESGTLVFKNRICEKKTIATKTPSAAVDCMRSLCWQTSVFYLNKWLQKIYIVLVQEDCVKLYVLYCF